MRLPSQPLGRPGERKKRAGALEADSRKRRRRMGPSTKRPYSASDRRSFRNPDTRRVFQTAMVSGSRVWRRPAGHVDASFVRPPETIASSRTAAQVRPVAPTLTCGANDGRLAKRIERPHPGLPPANRLPNETIQGDAGAAWTLRSSSLRSQPVFRISSTRS